MSIVQVTANGQGDQNADGSYVEDVGSSPLTFSRSGFFLEYGTSWRLLEVGTPNVLLEEATGGSSTDPASATWTNYQIITALSPGEISTGGGAGGSPVTPGLITSPANSGAVVTSPGSVAPQGVGSVPSAPGTTRPVQPGVPANPNNYLSTLPQTLTQGQRDQLALNWPDAVANGADPTFITPQDFGAVGDGSSHPASTLYATLADAQAVYPRIQALTEELDGLAIQKALDLGISLYLQQGVYRCSTPLECTTEGQQIRGESMTSTELFFVGGTDGFKVLTATDGKGLLPYSSNGSNSWGRIENIIIRGIGTVGTWGYQNVESATPSSLWIGEGWSFSMVHFLNWDYGFEFRNGARVNMNWCYFKLCASKALYIHSGSTTSNNAHMLYGLSVADSGIGLHLEGCRSATVYLQDFAQMDEEAVLVTGGNVRLVGGQMEVSDASIRLENQASVEYSNCAFITPQSATPIEVGGNSFLKVSNLRNITGGLTAPIIRVADMDSRVVGTASRHDLGLAAGDFKTAKVSWRVGGTDVAPIYEERYLEEEGYLRGISVPSATSANNLGRQWMQRAFKFNGRGVDDVYHIVNTANHGQVAVSTYHENLFSLTTDEATPFIEGHLNVVYLTGNNQTVNLRSFRGNEMRASEVNSKRITIVNYARTATKTINAPAGHEFHSERFALNGATTFDLGATDLQCTLISNGQEYGGNNAKIFVE